MHVHSDSDSDSDSFIFPKAGTFTAQNVCTTVCSKQINGLFCKVMCCMKHCLSAIIFKEMEMKCKNSHERHQKDSKNGVWGSEKEAVRRESWADTHTHTSTHAHTHVHTHTHTHTAIHMTTCMHISLYFYLSIFYINSPAPYSKLNISSNLLPLTMT